MQSIEISNNNQVLDAKTDEILDDKWKLILTEVGAFQTLDKLKDAKICPSIDKVFYAFQLTPFKNVKVVLIGQDPYPNEQAMGLSFSIPKNAAPTSSLKNMYACLGLDLGSSGDLTHWAQQGVLLLNTYLTTIQGTSLAHKKEWKEFLPRLLPKLNSKTVFILLGNEAQKYEKYCSGKVLKWGHPSPLNRYNKDDNPQNFKYCTCFKEAQELTDINFSQGFGRIHVDVKPTKIIKNKIIDVEKPNNVVEGITLIEKSNEKNPIIENIIEKSVSVVGCETPNNLTGDERAQPLDEMELFFDNLKISEAKLDILSITQYTLYTDGGATANGTPKAKASFAWCLVDQENEIASNSGRVYTLKTKDKNIYPSNNRGELTAIANGLKYALTIKIQNIKIVSDSEYCIKSCTIWSDKWIKEGTLQDKKNLDLIFQIRDMLAKLKYEFKHIKSHEDAPKKGSSEYTDWHFNDKADKLCSAELE